MENPPSSHPNSGHSSPTSRELLENASSFDEQPHSNVNRVKLMCSYGGKIQPRPHDHHFSYIGGDIKILAVDRSVKLSTLIGKLSSMANCNVCFKYQLPGEDLDALISVANDEDLDHMMIEYDLMCRASPKPARLKIFLFPFPSNNNNVSSDSSVSAINLSDTKSVGQWFIDALNSVHVPPYNESPPPPSSTAAATATATPDYLFGLDKPYSASPAANKAEMPATVPDFAAKDTECGPETVRETEIQEIERMQNENNEQKVKTNGENGVINGGVDCYSHENAEKVTPLVTNGPDLAQGQIHSGSVPVPVQVSEPVPVQPSYNVVGGGYSIGYPSEPVPLYLIQTASGLYQVVRPVTGPTGEPVYIAYPQMVNKFGYNVSGAPSVISNGGYSYVPERSDFPLQGTVAPSVEGWN